MLALFTCPPLLRFSFHPQFSRRFLARPSSSGAVTSFLSEAECRKLNFLQLCDQNGIAKMQHLLSLGHWVWAEGGEIKMEVEDLI